MADVFGNVFDNVFDNVFLFDIILTVTDASRIIDIGAIDKIIKFSTLDRSIKL